MDSHERVPLSPHSVLVSPRPPKPRAGHGISKKAKPKRLRKSDTLRKSSDHVTFPELYLIKKIGPKAAAAQFSQDFDGAYKNALKVAQSENPSWFSGSASDSDSDSDSDSSIKFKMPSDIAILEYTEYMQLFSSLSQSSSSSSSSESEDKSSSSSSSSLSPRPISPYMGGRNRKKNKTKKKTRKNKNTYRRRSSKKHNQHKKQSLKHNRK